MPMRAPWGPEFSVGHELIDAQHRDLLAQCDLLADLCAGAGDEARDRQFDQAFDRLKALAREHFETEASLLADRGFPDLEDHRIECDEFEYLASDIATAENFERLELQRFLTLWCIGHIKGSLAPQRALLAGGEAPS
jgi:hemerythrin-like metal-binding protein